MKRLPFCAVALWLAASAAFAQQPASSTPASDQKAAHADVLQSEQFSDAVANALLSRIREGFTRRNPKLFLSAFDAWQFPGYPLFADRIRARLAQSYDFRAYFRILNTVSQDSRRTVSVQWQIEQSPGTPGPPPIRNSGEARFTFERGPAGWRIVDLAPRDLLTGVRGPS